MGALIYTENNKFPKKAMEPIYLQYLCNINGLVEIFKRKIFKEKSERINDTFQSIG